MHHLKLTFVFLVISLFGFAGDEVTFLGKRDADCLQVSKLLADLTQEFIPGTSDNAQFALKLKDFRGRLDRAMQNMVDQIHGTGLKSQMKGMQLTNVLPSSIEEGNYWGANIARWANQSLRVPLQEAGLSVEKLKPSKRLVLVVHQWANPIDGRPLQVDAAEYIRKNHSQDPVVLLASHNFPVVEKDLIQEAKRGGLVYSVDGSVLHKNAEGKEIYRAMEVDADEITLMGGLCSLCAARAAKGAATLAFQNPNRKKLLIKVPAHLSYERELLANSYNGPNSKGNQLLILAMKYVPGPHWKMRENYSATHKELGENGRIRFYNSEDPPGQEREIEVDFND